MSSQLLKEDSVLGGTGMIYFTEMLNHPRALQELAEVIADPLAINFKNSWRSREIPDNWKAQT